METIEFFDYLKMAKKEKISKDIVQKIENDVREEFPNDKMLFELHVLRALKSKYWLLKEKQH